MEFKKVNTGKIELSNKSLVEIVEKKIEEAENDIKFYQEKWYQAEYMLTILRREKEKFDILNKVD